LLPSKKITANPPEAEMIISNLKPLKLLILVVALLVTILGSGCIPGNENHY
jgi:hypothetical protein